MTFCLVFPPLGLFLYNSWSTFLKYQAGNTGVQVNNLEWSTLIGRDHRDTVLSLVEPYYDGAKVMVHFVPFSVLLWHYKWLSLYRKNGVVDSEMKPTLDGKFHFIFL